MGRLSLKVVLGEPKSERDPVGAREMSMATPTSVARPGHARDLLHALSLRTGPPPRPEFPRIAGGPQRVAGSAATGRLSFTVRLVG